MKSLREERQLETKLNLAGAKLTYNQALAFHECRRHWSQRGEQAAFTVFKRDDPHKATSDSLYCNYSTPVQIGTFIKQGLIELETEFESIRLNARGDTKPMQAWKPTAKGEEVLAAFAQSPELLETASYKVQVSNEYIDVSRSELRKLGIFMSRDCVINNSKSYTWAILVAVPKLRELAFQRWLKDHDFQLLATLDTFYYRP